MKKNHLNIYNKKESLNFINSFHISQNLNNSQNIKLKPIHQLSFTKKAQNQSQLKSQFPQYSSYFQSSHQKSSKSLHVSSSNKVLQITKSYGQIIKTITYQQRRTDILHQLISLLRDNIKKQTGLTQQQKYIIKKLESQCNRYQDSCNINKQNHKKLKELILGQRKTRTIVSSKYKQLEKQLFNKQMEFKSVIWQKQQMQKQLSQLRNSIKSLKNNSPKKIKEQNQINLSTKPTDIINQNDRENRNQKKKLSKTLFLTNYQNQNNNQSKFTKTYINYPGDFEFIQKKFVIQKTTLAIQKIESIIGKPYQQLQTYFDQLKLSNKKLVQILQDINYEIDTTQNLLNQQINIQRNAKFNKQSIEKSIIISKDQNLLQELVSILNLSGSLSFSYKDISNNTVSLIFYKLQQLNKENQENQENQSYFNSLKINKQFQRKSTQFQQSERSSNYLSLSPQYIIANMSKFQNCQRILNRKQFKDQYQLQKSKINLKKIKIKNITQMKK